MKKKNLYAPRTLKPLILLFPAVIVFSCKKEKDTDAGCFSGDSTVRQITNTQATIQEDDGGNFYIVEQGAIDTKLTPCNMAQEFRVNNLPVTISGDVKATPRNAGEPCCTDNFVITGISR